MIDRYFILILCLILSACGVPDEVGKTWHQKMTVEVEINGETFKGSSVQLLRMNYRPANGTFINTNTRAINSINHSEAVVIDLKSHGTLFALWPHDYPQKYSWKFGEIPTVQNRDTPKK